MVNDPVSPFASNEVEDEAKKERKRLELMLRILRMSKVWLHLLLPAPASSEHHWPTIALVRSSKGSCTCSSYIIALMALAYSMIVFEQAIRHRESVSQYLRLLRCVCVCVCIGSKAPDRVAKIGVEQWRVFEFRFPCFF